MRTLCLDRKNLNLFLVSCGLTKPHASPLACIASPSSVLQAFGGRSLERSPFSLAEVVVVRLEARRRLWHCKTVGRLSALS
jgi:hypothetical protein